ncbi:hypothetical protein B7494_g8148 [Chlorociboria aeruginascens]|nr:hypothetical protein B7494_g8148 [Chlorociboria aeruginascens]
MDENALPPRPVPSRTLAKLMHLINDHFTSLDISKAECDEHRKVLIDHITRCSDSDSQVRQARLQPSNVPAGQNPFRCFAPTDPSTHFGKPQLGSLAVFPLEIRERIYQLVLEPDSEDGFPIKCRCKDWSGALSINLLMASHKICQEALPSLYRSGSFTLELSMSYSSGEWAQWEFFYNHERGHRVHIPEAPKYVLQYVLDLEIKFSGRASFEDIEGEYRLDRPSTCIYQDIICYTRTDGLIFHLPNTLVGQVKEVCRLLKDASPFRNLIFNFGLIEQLFNDSKQQIAILFEPLRILRGISAAHVGLYTTGPGCPKGFLSSVDTGNLPAYPDKSYFEPPFEFYTLAPGIKAHIQELMQSPEGTPTPPFPEIPMFEVINDTYYSDNIYSVPNLNPVDFNILAPSESDYDSEADEAEALEIQSEEDMIPNSGLPHRPDEYIQYMKGYMLEMYGTDDLTALHGTGMPSKWREWLDNEGHEQNCENRMFLMKHSTSLFPPLRFLVHSEDDPTPLSL